MMQAPQQLADFQHWLLAAITEPGQSSAVFHDEILASRRQSVADRLAVYQHAYRARLLECLRELFPVLTKTLGREDFDRFAAAYLERYPPSSYTLGDLAHQFAAFLRQTRPDAPFPDWPDFLIELATVEHAMDQVFERPGVENSPPLNLDRLQQLPPDELAAVRFVAAPCLRLFKLAYPINDYFAAVRSGQMPVWPSPGPSYLALTRSNYVVKRVPLEADEYEVLHSLADGAPLGEACNRASAITPERLASWTAVWGRLRLFVEVRCQH